ncbi:MAG: N-acetylmuramoyl-L-alanine amidase, partial [Actinomycetota bacterium]
MNSSRPQPAASRLIAKGARNEEVADIQARLRARGQDIDDDTGFFGESTRKAVRAFQQQRGILVDGIVGPHTWGELVEASWRLGDRPLYLRRPFFRGDDVVTLQTQLNALGFDAGREDGIFGERADRAVRGFQREYGILEDGILGPRTLDAIAGLRVDRPGTAAHLREELHRRQKAIEGALVVVDPGHGGDDLGKLGASGWWEVDVCWDIALRLADELRIAGATVRFTRTEAESLEASERARRANVADGDLFVSLHLNSHDELTAEGASTYHFTSSRAGAALAERIQQELAHLGLADCRAHGRSYTVLKETRM